MKISELIKSSAIRNWSSKLRTLYTPEIINFSPANRISTIKSVGWEYNP